MKRNLFLALVLVGLAACSTTSMTPPMAASLPVDQEPVLSPEAPPDVDFDGAEGADEAIEALGKNLKGERRNPWHRFTLTGSGMLVAQFDTTIRVDSKQRGEGTEIGLEDLLGLDENAAVLRVDLNYRFSRSHMLAASYYDIRRDGEQTLKKALVIEDQIFPAGARMDSRLDTQIWRLNYWWNFVTQDTWELGVGLGLYWMQIDARFSGTFQLPKVQLEETVEETVKVSFPPPLLGFRGAYAITDRLRLDGSLELLYVPIDQFKGWIVDINLGLEWDILDFAGIGLGYNYFTLGVEADRSGFVGTFDYRFHAVTGSIYFYF